jgi:NhaP-type Na+/H+ or K+/H+ antiporter
VQWWSGLRGAIAFALSLEASEDLADDGKGRVLLTTSLLIVLVTVLVNGGAAAYLLERLNLRNEPEARVPGSLPSSRTLSLSNLARSPGTSLNLCPSLFFTLRLNPLVPF